MDPNRTTKSCKVLEIAAQFVAALESLQLLLTNLKRLTKLYIILAITRFTFTPPSRNELTFSSPYTESAFGWSAERIVESSVGYEREQKNGLKIDA